MIPLRDANPSSSTPYVTYFIIAFTALIYFVQLSIGDAERFFVYTYGLVPARYTNPQLYLHFTPFHQSLSFFSYMFLHGNFLHLITNLWSLYIFGDNIEDNMGHIKYFVFYLMCGLVSGISHLAFNLDSTGPLIGASGAIAGVMGAYLILYPRAKVFTLFPVFFIPLFFNIPAFIFLGVWFFIQVFNAAGADVSQIAWWAHIGGFVFGIILLKIFSMLPDSNIEKKIQIFSKRKKTPGLHKLSTYNEPEDYNLYGQIEISPYEAIKGATKLINIPTGSRNRMIRLKIPYGIEDGNTIAVRGFGRKDPSGIRGDLLLKVFII